MPKHTKKRSTITRKHRRMKLHAKANKAKAQDNKQLAKEYDRTTLISGRSGRIENEY